MTTKKCIICGEEFDAHRNMKTCSNKCKEERTKKRMREYKKQWYLKNKEKIKEQQKRYREHNKEHIRKCWRESSQKWREQHKEYYKEWCKRKKGDDTMVEKKCVVCDKIFDARGSTITCSKECRVINNKNKKIKWYQNNKEKIQEYNKQYHQNNKEKISKYSEQYYQNNKEKILEHNKQYYQDNKEKILEHNEQYYQDNKEKILEQKKQYRQDNKEKISKRDKQYYQDNKEKILERNKQYQQNNKEKILEQKKQYYQNNKEKILEQKKQYQQDNKENILKYKKQRYEQAYKDLSNKCNVSVDDLKKWIPPYFIKRELECWEQGSYFLDFIVPMHERANGRCEITGKKTNDLVVHHLNGYNWCVEGRMDWDNAIVICRELHDAFHKKYGRGNNTAEQFWEFVEEWQKGIVTLDDFKE